MILRHLPRAISRCISAPVGLDRLALDAPILNAMRGAPIWFWGSSAMPAPPGCDGRCARQCRVRPGAHWRAPPSVRASARPSPCGPVPHLRAETFSSTARMVSMTWAWGLGSRLAHIPCTLRSAIMPKPTNSAPRKSRASRCLRLRQFGGWRIPLRGQAERPCGLRTPRHRSRAVAVLPTAGAFSGSSTRNGRRRALRKIVAAIKPLVAQPRARTVAADATALEPDLRPMTLT